MNVSEEEKKITHANSALREPYLQAPEIIHITLNENDFPATRRYIFVGDIHGCYDELKELFAKTKTNLKKDVVILIGDLINKGPKSVKVVQFARKHKILSVRGNHDDYSLCRLNNRREFRKNGLNPDDDEFLASYKWTDNFLPEDEEYLLSLPYTITIPSINVIAVHAGLIPHLPLEKQHPGGMYRMRNILKFTTSEGEEKYLSSDEADVGEACGSHWPGPSRVIFGHDAKRQLQFHPHALGLDTGCCYGGYLSLCIIDMNNHDDHHHHLFHHHRPLVSEVHNNILPPNYYIYQTKAHRAYEVPKFK